MTLARSGDMDKPKMTAVIHDRPKMPRATWEALRNHIIRQRKRKQEQEEKSEEYERLKKERENKKKQEASSLEETKEQISQLEQKLTNLKEEKHQLFLTLKKVSLSYGWITFFHWVAWIHIFCLQFCLFPFHD